jgi:tRNA threonylcarbamoyladenosine biosynthesis protein TsaE
MNYTSHSAEETQKIAADFAKTLKGGEVIGLVGELGAGKTTFTRGLVEALGGTVRVKSPTFTVMNEYPVNFGAIKRVVHIDFYRFSDASELSALSLEDERRPDTIIVAEWPDVFDSNMFTSDVTIRFISRTISERRIEIE